MVKDQFKPYTEDVLTDCIIENDTLHRGYIMRIDLGIFDYYLIFINVIGFILFAINTWLYSHTAEKQIDIFLTICSLLGGSFGIVIAILLIDRKAEKKNMMSRVFVSCVFVI